MVQGLMVNGEGLMVQDTRWRTSRTDSRIYGFTELSSKAAESRKNGTMDARSVESRNHGNTEPRRREAWNQGIKEKRKPHGGGYTELWKYGKTDSRKDSVNP
jgi:hypothetical protein